MKGGTDTGKHPGRFNAGRPRAGNAGAITDTITAVPGTTIGLDAGADPSTPDGGTFPHRGQNASILHVYFRPDSS